MTTDTDIASQIIARETYQHVFAIVVCITIFIGLYISVRRFMSALRDVDDPLITISGAAAGILVLASAVAVAHFVWSVNAIIKIVASPTIFVQEELRKLEAQ